MEHRTGTVLRESLDKRAYLEARANLPVPDGKHCIICGKDLPKYARKYCTQECFWDWYQKFPSVSWDDVRKSIMERDNYTCRHCGRRLLKEECKIDHIEALCLGGSMWDRNNLQTLCKNCHDDKTAEDRAKHNYLKHNISPILDYIPEMGKLGHRGGTE
jgi:5-methylcytosine-specific restriction endonuclease McrA